MTEEELEYIEYEIKLKDKKTKGKNEEENNMKDMIETSQNQHQSNENILSEEENNEKLYTQDEKSQDILFAEISVIKPQNNFDSFSPKKEENYSEKDKFNISNREENNQLKKYSKFNPKPIKDTNSNEQNETETHIILPANTKQSFSLFEERTNLNNKNSNKKNYPVFYDNINTSKSLYKKDYFYEIFQSISSKKITRFLSGKIFRVNNNTQRYQRKNKSSVFSSSINKNKKPNESNKTKKSVNSNQIEKQKYIKPVIVEKIMNEIFCLSGNKNKQKNSLFRGIDLKVPKEKLKYIENLKDDIMNSGQDKYKGKKNSFEEINEKLEILIKKIQKGKKGNTMDFEMVKKKIGEFIKQERDQQKEFEEEEKKDNEEEDNGEEEQQQEA